MERGLPFMCRDCQGRLSMKGAAVFVEGLSVAVASGLSKDDM